MKAHRKVRYSELVKRGKNNKALKDFIVDEVGSMMKEVYTDKTRKVLQCMVDSGKVKNQFYMLFWDFQYDGVFSAARYPFSIPTSKRTEVSVVLTEANYYMRYGKYVMNFDAGTLEFRVFQSSADIEHNTEEARHIMRNLPVQMLDKIANKIDKIVFSGLIKK